MHILTDPDAAVIAEAIIALGHSLRLNVVAEGVETQEQYNFLKKLNCNQAQGYYLSKPLPADEFMDFVQCQKTLHSTTEIKLSA